MRRRTPTLVGLALAFVIVAVAAVDLVGPSGGLTPGSASAIVSRDGLTLASEAASCDRPPTQCPARYAFAPGRVLTLWISVRNASSVDLTVDGIGDWVRSLPPAALVHPVDAIDGGTGSQPFEDATAPFVSATLSPGAERLIGIRLRTTSDVRFACEHWATGTAIGWSEVPVTWHWAVARHATKVRFMREFQMSAPTASDCKG
jgi:hypothetical protein